MRESEHEVDAIEPEIKLVSLETVYAYHEVDAPAPTFSQLRKHV